METKKVNKESREPKSSPEIKKDETVKKYNSKANPISNKSDLKKEDISFYEFRHFSRKDKAIQEGKDYPFDPSTYFKVYNTQANSQNRGNE